MSHTIFRVLACTSIALLSSATLAQDSGWRQDAIDRAVQHHQDNTPQICELARDESKTPLAFELPIGEETAARLAMLVQFPCRLEVGGQSSVFLLSDQHGTVSRVLFPSPFVVNQDQSGTNQTTGETRIGTRDELEVTAAKYDESSRTMVEVELWPGPGEAYSMTQWGFRDGRFQVMRFAVDASRDGQDNAEVLVANELW